MAPKKNKKHQPKGPYFFFMQEFRQKREAEGYVFRGGNHEVQMKASPHWNAMSIEERKPYQKMADDYREQQRANGEKFTSQGVPLSMVEAEQKQRMARADLIKNTINTMLTTASDNNELEKLEVYFISFAYFCVTSSGTYIPAEMGVVRYSLKDGVKDKLHMFIDPGKLPLGMAYDAKQHSEGDHQLPIPPDAMGEKDNDEIILKLFSFLSQQEKMPPLFTDVPDIRMVENILKGILNQGAMDENTLLVCPLAELFYQLKRATEKFGLDIKTFPSVHIAQAIIQKDVYEYTKDIACDFHEEQGNGKYCPLSKCIRWAYIISDSCCLDLSIEMKPGKHLPINADTNLCTTSLGDTTSFVSVPFDTRSFVSSSEVTHLTMPKVQKYPGSYGSSYDGRSNSSRMGGIIKRSSATPSSSSYRDYESSGRTRSLKDEDESDTYETASSSSRRPDSRYSYGSREKSPSRSSYDSFDRRGDRSSGSSIRREHDRDSGFERARGRGGADYDRGRYFERGGIGDRYSPDRTSSNSDRRGASLEHRHSKERSRGGGISDSDRDDDMNGGGGRRSADLPRDVGGYGRGALYSKTLSSGSSPPRGSGGRFGSNDFPELGSIRSAGRGQLSK